MINKPRILGISYYFPPHLTPTSINLALLVHRMEEQRNAEWTIICASTPVNPFPQDQRLLSLVKCDTKRILSLENRYLNYLRRKFFPSIMNPSLTWVSLAKLIGERVIAKHSIDVLMSFSTPLSTHEVGLYLHEKTGIPWIASLSDPITKNYVIGKTSEKIEKKLGAFENTLFSHADTLIFTNQFQVAHMNEHSEKIAKKTEIIEHWYDQRLYPPVDMSEKRTRHQLMMSYIGHFYGQRQPDVFFEALGLLKETKPDILQDIKFNCVGSDSTVIRDKISRYKISAFVQLTKPVGYFDSLKYMVNSDLLVVIDAKLDYSPYLPLKVIQYFGAGRPIFAITPQNGPTARLMEDLNQFYDCSYDPMNIARIIEKIWMYWKKGELDQYQPDEKKIQKYTVDHASDEVMRIIRGLL